MNEGTFLTPLKIENGDWLNECPHCGGINLHQTDVSIFNGDGSRYEWDEKTQAYAHVPVTRVTHVMTDGTITTTAVNPNATNNPSMDRNGLLMEFFCETCDDKPVLAIFQHEGTTFIGWK